MLARPLALACDNLQFLRRVKAEKAPILHHCTGISSIGEQNHMGIVNDTAIILCSI